MSRKELRRVEAALVEDAPGNFTESELHGLPAPVASYLRSAVAVGTPLALTARINMRGRIKIGRWVPFRAIEILSPHLGFVWAARAAGIISGSDRFVEGDGGMDWKLAGLLPVMRSAGPEISRSAAERAAAEAVWIPTALLPRFGVDWSTTGDRQISARYRIADYPVRIDYSLTDDCRIRSVRFDRWGDPDGTGTFGVHVFGGEFTAHTAFDGVTIPSEGRLGWHYGTDRWGEGEFFRYRITNLELVTGRRTPGVNPR
jgi:hypothetical protein